MQGETTVGLLTWKGPDQGRYFPKVRSFKIDMYFKTVHHMYAVPAVARRGCQILCNWSYSGLCATRGMLWWGGAQILQMSSQCS